MKALSILQPWAWLILNAGKDIENRTWPARHRGPLLIHAGKGFDHAGADWLRNHWHHAELPGKVGDMFDMIRDGRLQWRVGENKGGIVGRVDLVDCVREHPSHWKADDAFGFVLANPQPLPFRPFKGALGFFEVPDE